MKTNLIKLVAVLVILAILCSTNVFASSNQILTFDFGVTQTYPGKIVDVPVYISNNTGISTFRIKLSYDSMLLELISVEKGSRLNQGTLSYKNFPEKNYVNFLWYSVSDFSGNGEVVVLRFKVSENVTKNIPLSASFLPEDILDYNSNPINCIVNNGIINIRTRLVGDIFYDGRINAADAVLLAQYLANWDVDIDTFAADCNGDGILNAVDAVLLAQYLAGWDVVLG